MTKLLSFDPITLLFYAGVLYALLHLFYIAVAGTRWDELDVEALSRRRLHLAHLLKLLEAPDVQAMSNESSDRQGLFPRLSHFLLQDVLALVRSEPGRLRTLIWGGVFLAGYSLIRTKSLIAWGRNDLHFLAGIELALVRSLAKYR